MPTDWDSLLLAYLHDPPDKALDIKTHESRAAELARIAMGQDITAYELHRDTRREDQTGSACERLPLPNAGPNYDWAVRVENDQLRITHPLSAATCDIAVSALSPDAMRRTLTDLVRDLDPPRQRFLAVWRLWRDRLADEGNDWARLPAETRVPDHTIWNHLDIVAGMRAALAGTHGPAFLSFALGPVQTFIAAARSVRDLWTGSYLLSWLTFQAMRPILRDLGPTTFVYPSLRGNPLLDLYLAQPDQGLAGRIHRPDDERLLLPCLPNRFVALVPGGADGKDALALAAECEQACRNAWSALCAQVHDSLDRKCADQDQDWDKLWQAQVESFFELTTTVLPEHKCRETEIGRLLAESGNFDDAVPAAAAVRSLNKVIPEDARAGYPRNAGLWMGQIDVLGRAAEAQRSVRHVPDYRPTGEVPPKCSLLGTYEQMGPANLEESAKFWQRAAKAWRMEATRLSERERLCAVSLVKRFAWPVFLAKGLGVHTNKGRFADAATVAAALWLKDDAQGRAPIIDPIEVQSVRESWSGQWLHWTNSDDKNDEPPPPDIVRQDIETKRKHQGMPPTYYAILMIDGDELGKWLRGEKMPLVQDLLHPKIRGVIGQWQPGTDKYLNSRRPVGPALHAAISEALANFALHFVPDIVRKHSGELIYAGGDDVLALLPTVTALVCARDLNNTYRQNWKPDSRGRQHLLLGEKATLSAGLAVVHYKEDLRLALGAARAAEKSAKNNGRDALTLTICRRSGEHSSALLPWCSCSCVEELVKIFAQRVTDRWAYKLRAELPTLAALPWPAIEAEVKRLLKRLEAKDRKRIEETALKLFEDYHRVILQRRKNDTTERPSDESDALTGFVTLCQSASFLARGRDE